MIDGAKLTRKKRAVVVCPGRGVYNKAELGYLARLHGDKRALLAGFDAQRRAAGQALLSELDGAAHFSSALHTRGDNASALIFAATYADFLDIDADAYDVVAATGNSMGWYSALACAGALDAQEGFRLANTMGRLMQEALIGGQSIYPFVGEDWRPDAARKRALLALAAEIDARPGHRLALSIDLGGMLVLAGDEAGLSAFEAAVPQAQGRFPMRLPNHAAFHTSLQEPVAAKGRELLAGLAFRSPRLPIVDGRGAIWWPHSSDLDAMFAYTLGAQVVDSYDFTHAIAVAAREFAPDLFIVTGPGATLGGAIAQSLIIAGWRDLASKQDFSERQARDPALIAMGLQEQRASATGR